MNVLNWVAQVLVRASL